MFLLYRLYISQAVINVTKYKKHNNFLIRGIRRIRAMPAARRVPSVIFLNKKCTIATKLLTEFPPHRGRLRQTPLRQNP
jgi:hypothetical protein